MSRDPAKHKAARDAWRAKHRLIPLYLTPADLDALARARRQGETMNACIKRLLHAAPVIANLVQKWRNDAEEVRSDMRHDESVCSPTDGYEDCADDLAGIINR